MKNNKLLNFILKYSIIPIILSPFILILIWGMPGMSYEIDKYELDKKFETIGKRWDIGSEKGFGNKICDTYIKKGCLNGELKGVKKVIIGSINSGINLENIYLYIKISKINIKKDLFGRGFMYNLFGPYDYRLIDTLENIPKYGFIIGDEIYLLNEKDLKSLSQEQQNIFKELEKNPSIIINGVDYTK